MAKDINKKEKKIKKDGQKTKRKINPFDIIIVLLLLCLLGTLGYRVYDGVSVENSKKESNFVLDFECEGVYNSLADYLGENTAVYLQSGELLGYVYSGEDGSVQILEELTEGGVDLPEDVEPEESLESGEFSETSAVEEVENEAGAEKEESLPVYRLVNLGGRIRLSHSAFKVEDGGYYTVGETNFAVGSVIEVHTDKAVFTLKIVGIETVD